MEDVEIAKKKLAECWSKHEAEFKKEMQRLDDAERALHHRVQELNAEKKKALECNGNTDVASDDDLVEINAGGKIIVARRSTLTQLKGTRLEALFSGRWDKRLQRDAKGRIFLDVNSICFQAIVDYLNELVISPPNFPSEPPHVESELQHVLVHQLELFGITDDITLFDTSKILSNINDWGMIFNWLKEEECDGSVRLLYRASRDGFSHTSFRKKCSNRGPTLTIINDANGRVFGGFVDGSWSLNDDNTEIKSSKAFIFLIHGDKGSIQHVKSKLRTEEAAAFNRTGFGPCFGACEATSGNFPLSVAVDDKEVYLNASFFASNMTSSNVRELEVYRVISKNQMSESNRIRKKAPEEARFTASVNKAVVERWQKIYNAQSSISLIEEKFADEGEFIFSFASGASKDTIFLNVTGTEMATKRATLQSCEESVLARQFDDSVWKNPGSKLTISTWTHEKVLSWLSGVDGVTDEIMDSFEKNKITGPQLLALGKEGLDDLGVKQKGVLYLLLKEIKDLEQKELNPVTFIEHSPYCFGKIIDYLRMKENYSNGLVDSEPAYPQVRTGEKGKFEKIVRYYFPGECSSFILGYVR
eukprot:CCRYP_005305-RA/>CCRYP_005305-RA protein AED:0.32 eAED:0.32 QI:309/1/1/1/0.66/0.5/4/823/587